MHRSDDVLVSALLKLVRFFNDPRQDRRLMAVAGLDLDPAFLPLLVRLGSDGPAGVVELSGPLGRDHSTVSRQLARLETAGLVARAPSEADGRVRIADLTPRGDAALAAVAAARRRGLDHVLADWTPDERDALGDLLARFADGLTAAAKPPP